MLSILDTVAIIHILLCGRPKVVLSILPVRPSVRLSVSSVPYTG